jgi:hypothetical protein
VVLGIMDAYIAPFANTESESQSDVQRFKGKAKHEAPVLVGKMLQRARKSMGAMQRGTMQLPCPDGNKRPLISVDCATNTSVASQRAALGFPLDEPRSSLQCHACTVHSAIDMNNEGMDTFFCFSPAIN